MKKTILSRGIYVEGLRRLRVFGFILLAVMLIVQLSPMIVFISDYFMYENSYIIEDVRYPYDEPPVYEPETINFSLIMNAVPWTVTIGTFIMCLILFGVFNKRSSSDFYHSLPYTRACIFTSSVLSIMTWIVGICVICSAIGLIGYSAFPDAFTVIYDGAADLLLSYVALFIIVLGATTLAMSATGTVLTNICVSFLILFLPRFIIIIMTSWISSNAEFLVLTDNSDSFLSPYINVLFGSVYELFLMGDFPDLVKNITSDIYSLILGFAYLGLGVFVFVKRKSETATCPAPGRVTQHIIRIMLAMTVGIFSTILFIEHHLSGFLIVSLITAVVYFAYELITTHRWKNCLKALPFLGVVAGLCILCGIIIVTVPKIASLYTPEPEEIDSVRLVSDGDDRSYWFGSQGEDFEIKDEAVLKIVSHTLKANMEDYRDHGSIYYSGKEGFDSVYYYDEGVTRTVAIKDGYVTKYRQIHFTGEDHAALISLLEKNEDYVKEYQTLPEPAEGSIYFSIYNRPDADEKIYERSFECLQEEIYSLTLEEWYDVATMSGNTVDEYSVYYDSNDYHSKSVELQISAKVFPKTFDILLETEEAGYDERFEDVKRIITDESLSESDTLWYMCIDVSILAPAKDGVLDYYTCHTQFEDYEEETFVNPQNRETLIELMEAIEKTDKKPSHEGYVCISYQYDSDEESIYDTIYLPLPDGYDPIENNFTPIFTYSEETIKYN